MKQSVFFDLDGTLADSGEGIMRCACYALEQMGIHTEDFHSLKKFVGPPLEDSFMQFYGMTAVQANQAIAYYRERFFDKGMYEIYVYPGIEDCLHRLQSAGYILAIATSRTATSARQILDSFDLSHYFDCIGGRDECYRLHTKAEVIADTLQQLNLTADNVVMVGDRCFDIEGAHSCGMDSIGILWGYGDRNEMTAAEAGQIFSTVDELTEYLLNLRNV